MEETALSMPNSVVSGAGLVQVDAAIAAAHVPPVVSASHLTAAYGQSIAASHLFSVTDSDGSPLVIYAFADKTPGASNGHFVFNGVTENSGFLVSASQLSEVSSSPVPPAASPACR